jgi:hypothetical protein
MDVGIADTINRIFAQKLAGGLDTLYPRWHEHRSPVAATLMGDSSDRAWLVGFLVQPIPDLEIDSVPADADWDNLFSNIRAEILARRDPETPPTETPATRPGDVV